MWHIACALEHPRADIIEASRSDQNKEPLNGKEVLGVGIFAFVTGFLGACFIFVFYLTGRWRREDFGGLKDKVGYLVSLGIQVFLFVLLVVFVSMQKKALKKR